MPRTQPAQRGIPYFAAFLDLVGKRVLVVGGGKIASGKVKALLPCQPGEIVVVAPRVTKSIRDAATDHKLAWHQREFAPEDITPATALVFAATDDRALNARVAEEARARHIPVLAVDDVPNCDFIAPALVRRGDVTIAISTAGRSPAMARRTRELLDKLVPQHWGDLLEVAAEARDRLGSTRTLVEPDDWQAALQGDVERLVEVGQKPEATELLLRKLERSLFQPQAHQHEALVSLVGAGPGDPDLLTLKALKRLQSADVIVHDRLVSDEILSLANAEAERIDVGKAPGGRGCAQADINALLVRLGEQGKRVVRLKGGDPLVFGRGGEEALALAEADIPFEIVPGVSSAIAAPAAAGIPVTHRGLSASLTVVEGHDPARIEWPLHGTLVCLMATERLEDLTASMLDAGRPLDEPAALIQWATTAKQRVLTARLRDIAHRSRLAGIGAPAVLVVGPTAALAQDLGRHRERAKDERVLAYT